LNRNGNGNRLTIGRDSGPKAPSPDGLDGTLIQSVTQTSQDVNGFGATCGADDNLKNDIP
jgi:hypothetical protein